MCEWKERPIEWKYTLLDGQVAEQVLEIISQCKTMGEAWEALSHTGRYFLS